MIVKTLQCYSSEYFDSPIDVNVKSITIDKYHLVLGN